MNKLEIFKQLLFKKRRLLRCIFSTLLCQIIVTSVVVFYIYKTSTLYNYIVKDLATPHTNLMMFLLVAINTFLIFAMMSFKMSFTFRFILFTIFSIMQGLFLGVISKYIPKEIILSALVSTISIFIIFLVVGFIIVYFGFDISWLGIYLFIALLGLIIAQIVFMFIPKSYTARRYIVIFALLLFSIYILYDTNLILLKYKDDGKGCIGGSLSYYLDIMNTFLYSLDSR